MKGALWLCGGVVVGYVALVVYVRLLEAVWDEGAAWQKAWKATEQGSEAEARTRNFTEGVGATPESHVSPFWRRDGGP